MNGAAQPDADYFAVMAARATGHWWYVARRELFRQLLAGRVQPGATALDVGCGTGETMAVLRQLGAHRVAGTDLSENALAYARHHPQGAVLAATAEQLPFADGCADVLVSSDVLEHLSDDRRALREYRRVLKPGGLLLVTVPSYQWLWCAHDVRAGHRRRYRLAELTAAVGSAHFRVERSSYFFSYLVPPAIALRRTPLGRLTADTDEAASAGRVSSAVLSRLGSVERVVLRRHSIPFGLSQVMLASAIG